MSTRKAQLTNSEFFHPGSSPSKLIISFGGMALKSGSIPPFEFLRFVRSTTPEFDSYFYIDRNQAWYHKGIRDITSNLDETISYLREKIKDYEEVLFIGVSAGGYAALLFGSILNVKAVIAFVPQTILGYKEQMDKNPQFDYSSLNDKYTNIAKYINRTTKYVIYGDVDCPGIGSMHHISHVENIEKTALENVGIIKRNGVNVKEMRDSGELEKIIRDCLE